MSNHHWVCFTCREAVRRPGGSAEVRCPSCAAPCRNIGYKTPVPTKSKQKLWKELEAEYVGVQENNETNGNMATVRNIHELEKEINRIQRLPENPGRCALIKSLNKQLEAVRLKK